MLYWKNRGTRSMSRKEILPLCSMVECTFWSSKHRKEVDKDDWVQQRITERLWNQGWFSQGQQRLWGHRTESLVPTGDAAGLFTAVHGMRVRQQQSWNTRSSGWSHEDNPAAWTWSVWLGWWHPWGFHGQTGWSPEQLRTGSVRAQIFPLVPTSLNRILWEMRSHTSVFFAKCSK